MKFSPVRIDEKPAMKTPTTASDHVAVRVHASRTACRTSSRCRRRPRAARTSVSSAAGDEQIPAQQVEPRKGEVRAPIISGTRKLPSVVGIDGIRKNHTMTTPCDREQPVVGVGRDQVALRRDQLEPDQRRRRAADEEERR